MKKTIPILILIILGLLTTVALTLSVSPVASDPARFELPHKSTPTTTPVEFTKVEAPQFIEFANGDAALCVNCPKISVTGTAKNIDIICKNTEKSCDLYFGFSKSKPQSGMYPENSETGALRFSYKIANAEEFKEQGNFIVKKVVAPTEAQYLADNYKARPKYFPKIEGGAEATLTELVGKVFYKDEDLKIQYTISNLDSAGYMNLKNALVSFNEEGEIISINGLEGIASTQKIVPVIGTTQGAIQMEVPLKKTEKLTFNGLSGKEEYSIASPIFEVYKLDPKQSFDEWLKSLDSNYKLEDEGWWLELCKDEKGSLAFWDYAPGSKFQIAPAAEGCSINSYRLTTEKDERELPRKPYVCGEINYYAKPGKITSMNCNMKDSIIICSGDECKKSELTWVDETRDNEIEIGTNDFQEDSKFASIEKTEEGFEIEAEELKLYRDYILPSTEVTVSTGKLITPEGAHITLKAKTGTIIIREWIDKNVGHNLETDTNGKDVNYMVSVFRGSTVNPARIDAIYPDYFDLSEHGMPTEEKAIYKGLYGAGIEPQAEGGAISLDETSIRASPRVNRLPTLGIKIKTEKVLGQSSFDVNYFAIPEGQLKDRGAYEVTPESDRPTVTVTKGKSIYDILAQYCFKKDSSELDTEQDSAIRAVAEKILTEASNPDSINKGFFKPGFSGFGDPVFRGGETEYVITQKDGELTLPESGDITFLGKSDFETTEPMVTIHSRLKCNIERAPNIDEIFPPAKTKKSKGELQTCTSGNCYTVKKGDVFRKIFNSECADSGIEFLKFRLFVLEHNPIAANRNAGWKDNLMAGDRLSIPLECAKKTAPKQIEAPAEPEELLCPTSDADCQALRLSQLGEGESIFGIVGGGRGSDFAGLCENAFSGCTPNCKWHGKIFGASMKFCRLDRENLLNKETISKKPESEKEERNCPKTDEDCTTALIAQHRGSSSNYGTTCEKIFPGCSRRCKWQWYGFLFSTDATLCRLD